MFRTIDSSNYKYITEKHLPGYVSSSNSPVGGSSTNPLMTDSNPTLNRGVTGFSTGLSGSSPGPSNTESSN
jgi:hypothetical protein